MVQATNQVSLYRKLDEELKSAAKLTIQHPIFTYRKNGSVEEIKVNEDFTGDFKVNDFDAEWVPHENDLTIRQKFVFENPSKLFGEGGLALDGSEIGLAAHLHSKTSSFQKKIPFGTITNTTRTADIVFNYDFTKDSLRGNLNIDYFLYLKKCTDAKSYQANQVGMILSEEDLYNLTITIDGEGSSFPMSEFSDKNGPLWLLEKNWVDASEDTFDISNVNLSLNIAHPLFSQIKEGKTKANRILMGDIMIQAMAMIIQQVIIVESKNIEDADEGSTSSILAVVKYWVETFEVDTTSLFSIMNTLRSRLERDMMGGE